MAKMCTHLGDLAKKVKPHTKGCEECLKAGVPTLLVGPAGDNYHALDEWVSISECVQMTEILRRTIENLLA